MPDISAAAHAQILQAIRQSQTEVQALRDATRRDPTKVQTGYMGFQMTEVTLGNFYQAVENQHDKTRVIEMLRTAIGALAIYGGGDVAPAVQDARDLFTAILRGLEGGATPAR